MAAKSLYLLVELQVYTDDAGTELAVANSNVQTITYHYQSVIDQYGTMRLDFDVEGSAAQDTRSVDRRNRAIAALQRKNPGLVVSYTLAATPGGLDSGGLAILRSAKRNYANIDGN